MSFKLIVCKKILVSGKVQGVFYRDSARQQAQIFSLSGYVMNLPDGQVEIEVCGEQSNIEEFQQWLWKGPIMSKVENVQVQEISIMNYSGFEIR